MLANFIDSSISILANVKKKLAGQPAFDIKRYFSLPITAMEKLSAIYSLAPDRAELLLTTLHDGLQQGLPEQFYFFHAEILANAIYPKYRFSDYARIHLEDEDFLQYYQHFMDTNNWHSFDRKYTLAQLIKLTKNLTGDFAECGTYKGASAYLMCVAAKNTNRLVHLFDSFEGLSDPGTYDGNYWESGRFKTSESEVLQNLSEFTNYRAYKGWIPDRFIEVANRQFSFLHIDVDLYQPTLDSLKFFYERMEKKGILLFDDYGFKTCPGAKLAIDEFFEKLPEPIIMLPTGQAFGIKN